MKEKKIMVGAGIRFERIRRITGYLVGTVDRFNTAKRAEERDRIKHTYSTVDGPKTMEKHMNKKAFCTIELLAIVAILGILLTIHIAYVRASVEKIEDRVSSLESNYEDIVNDILEDGKISYSGPTIEEYEDQIEEDISAAEDLIEDLESEVQR